MLIWKINALIWFRWMKKKTSSLIEDKRIDKVHRVHTRRNPKRHIPPVSLLLWRKMVTVRCFVWALGLQLWSVSESDEISSFGDLKKIDSFQNHAFSGETMETQRPPF